ncbi:MAG TPA: DKNYY domain-containing protein [Paludibacter sp.]|nr:DKNYY domain-containing protein [Paludibacter sp.]
MKTNSLILILTFITLTSCEKVEKFGNFTTYKKLDDKTTYILEIKGDSRNYSYQSDLNLDIKTLKDLGEFLTDTNKVYRKYDISDGTLILELENVDKRTFSTFGKSIYARDNKHIFDSRNCEITKADLESFRPVELKINGHEVTGRDKTNYYFWNEIVSDTTKHEKL